MDAGQWSVGRSLSTHLNSLKCDIIKTYKRPTATTKTTTGCKKLIVLLSLTLHYRL